MNDSFRLRVLKALTAKLQTITIANGYKHDLSASVFRGRTRFGDDEPLPMVSMIEPPLAIDQMATQTDSKKNVGSWDLLIQGWVQDDHENPCDPAYRLEADIRRALASAKDEKIGRTSNILGLGGGRAKNGIIEMRIGAPVIRPPDETSAKACCYIILTFEIAEDMADPFS